MKPIIIIPILIFSIMSCTKATEPNQTQEIKILIRQVWIVGITSEGVIYIDSSVDSNPFARAHTKKNAVDYTNLRKRLLLESKVPRHDKAQRVKKVYASLTNDDAKYYVSEKFLFDLLSAASKKWEFPSPSKRFLELLDRKPLLENLKMQNKALHPTGGGVTPKKEP